MKFQTNTDILKLLDAGLYESYLGRIVYGEDKLEKVEQNLKVVENEALRLLNELFLELPFKAVLSNPQYWHPKFYNYETDCILFDIEVDENFLDKYVSERLDYRFYNFIFQHYCSYDGFLSFYPYTKEKFHDVFKSEHKYKCVNQVITYYIACKVWESKDITAAYQFDNLQWDFIENVYERIEFIQEVKS